MLARLIVALLAVAALLGGCGSDEEPSSGGAVAPRVAEQLKYVDPDASAVIAIDARWGGANWDEVRPIVDRLLEKYRETAPPSDRAQVPRTGEDALELLAGFAKLSFRKDIEPLLDGHLVVGVVQHPPREVADEFDPGETTTVSQQDIVYVYRTEKGDPRRVIEAIYGQPLEPLAGDADTLVAEDEIALIGGKTIVLSASDGSIRKLLDRAKQTGGFAQEKLAAAERDAGLEDPLVLMTGDLTLAYEWISEESLERARSEVPYLGAITRGSAALDVTDDGIEARAHLATGAQPLTERDLPVGPDGDVELPESEDGTIVGGSRDQSYTTTFASRVARALFADSRFAKAVEKTERELGIEFEDEVLKQFDCPSVSLLDPGEAGVNATQVQRFGARSCVRDPERMRELLPKLRPHLPEILTSLQGLGDEGLAGLLLIAPDAPLTPGALLADIVVKPFKDDEEELLYEITGLRDDTESQIAQAGPAKIVFGLIGKDFVVASDDEMARRAADAKTEKLDEQAASAVRVPLSALLLRNDPDGVEKALAAVFGDLVASISAKPDATVAKAKLELED